MDEKTLLQAVERVGFPRGHGARPLFEQLDAERARELLRAGFSNQQVARLFGVSRTTLWRTLHAHR